MLKSELITRMAQRYPNLFARDIEKIVTTILDEISHALAEGGRVELRGFGAFNVRHRAPRSGRNPRTGADVEIGAKSAVHFKPGKEMRERLNASAKRG